MTSCDTSTDPIPNSQECIKACLDDPGLNCQRTTANYKMNAIHACATYNFDDMPEECCTISSVNDDVKGICAQKCIESDSFGQDACENVESEIEEYCGTNLNEKCCTDNYRDLQEDECQKVFPVNYKFDLKCGSNGRVKFEPETIDIIRGNKNRYVNCEEDPQEQTFGDFDFKCLPSGTLEVNQNNFPDDNNNNKKSSTCLNNTEDNTSGGDNNTFKVTNTDGKINITCGNKIQEITCEDERKVSKDCGSMFLIGFIVCFILIITLFVISKRSKLYPKFLNLI